MPTVGRAFAGLRRRTLPDFVTVMQCDLSRMCEGLVKAKTDVETALHLGFTQNNMSKIRELYCMEIVYRVGAGLSGKPLKEALTRVTIELVRELVPTEYWDSIQLEVSTQVGSFTSR